MRALKFITGHVIYNPAYTYKFQLKTTIGSADLMLYMGFIGPNYSSGGGIAYLATVCEGDSYRKYKQSINNYGTSHSSMGELLAHEIGHNLGKLSLIDGVISTVKSRAVDRSTIQFWTILSKGHST
jgi:hypothetical protein